MLHNFMWTAYVSTVSKRVSVPYSDEKLQRHLNRPESSGSERGSAALSSHTTYPKRALSVAAKQQPREDLVGVAGDPLRAPAIQEQGLVQPTPAAPNMECLKNAAAGNILHYHRHT